MSSPHKAHPRDPSSVTSLAPLCGPKPHTLGMPPSRDFLLLGLCKSQSWVTLPWPSEASPLESQDGSGQGASKPVHVSQTETDQLVQPELLSHLSGLQAS